jgi:rhodanese-related sulfurtransferase
VSTYLTPAQAQEFVSRGELEVIDVREVEEWAAGHIAGARLVPLAEFRANPRALCRDGVLFVCTAGMRSQTAARLAKSLGYERVYDLRGGTRAWAAAGLPLVKDLPVAV